MPKEAIFTMKLETELHDAFMAEAEAANRPASHVMRDLMRGFIQQQQQAREYEAFVEAKVEKARASLHAGTGISNEQVEAEFAARREAVKKQI